MIKESATLSSCSTSFVYKWHEQFRNGRTSLEDDPSEGRPDDSNDVEKTIQTLVKISCVVTENDAKSKHTVCEQTDKILKQLFETGGDNAGSLIANAYLVYLGILKGEDKKYKPPSDITGPLIVLEHAVRQKYFTRNAKKLICAFMDKPHPLLTKSSNIRNTLLQTLYTT